MRPPGFWSRPEPTAVARLLRPLGLAYGALTARRMARPGWLAPVPVICVGNFTLGGAGKTPTALAVASLLARAGHRPAFLSRGYGGSLPGPVRVDPDRHGPDEVGDEPLLLARAAPATVSRDRPAGARLAIAEGATCLVMDDGLQNPSLAKTFSLAVVDGEAGAGNWLPFPAGPLRASLAAQWPHVGAVVLIGGGTPGERIAREAGARGIPILRGVLEPDAEAAERLRGRPVLAFAGIGRPEKFFRTLEGVGARVVGRRAFPDHHAFTEGEVQGLLREAEAGGLALVTTEKDRVRLPASFPADTLPVRLALADEAALAHLLATRAPMA